MLQRQIKRLKRTIKAINHKILWKALEGSGPQVVREGVPQPRGCRGEGPVAHGAELGSGGLKGVCVRRSEGA